MPSPSRDSLLMSISAYVLLRLELQRRTPPLRSGASTSTAHHAARQSKPLIPYRLRPADGPSEPSLAAGAVWFVHSEGTMTIALLGDWRGAGRGRRARHGQIGAAGRVADPGRLDLGGGRREG